MSPSDRGGSSGGLSMQTLVLAACGSGIAAVLTSTFWPGGSILSAALTPVIVALVSESLRKPTARIGAVASTGIGRARPSRRRGRGRGDRPADGPDQADDGRPYTVYGAGAPRIRPAVVFATAGIAFFIAVLALTVPERIFGGAVANDRSSTFFPGSSKEEKEREEPKPERTSDETTTSSTSTDEETTTTVPEDPKEGSTTTTIPETPGATPTPTQPEPGQAGEPTPSPSAPEPPG